MQALKVQDRTIRLEERLRYREILDPELAKRASDLPTSQIIALRFAPDAELAVTIYASEDGDKKQYDTSLNIRRVDWNED